jgi:hypothetical protein
MKILKCDKCHELVPMDDVDLSCGCGACTGRYVNLRKVTFSGPCVVYGVSSLDFHRGDDKWREKMYPIIDSPYVQRRPEQPD